MNNETTNSKTTNNKTTKKVSFMDAATKVEKKLLISIAFIATGLCVVASNTRKNTKEISRLKKHADDEDVVIRDVYRELLLADRRLSALERVAIAQNFRV